ncbi:hypothetical protein AAF712_015790 [Marasmius tenuissimus]|uniref:WYL domain-containing protein n=1 Tax=Marasmius tenuissimus TaxID=585030 RepID=A0ABR2Z8E1_9AGAR
MSDSDASALTPKMGTLSFEEKKGGWVENLEGELDFEGTLFLDYMLKNEPFETLYKQYIPHEGFDHHPPKFEYEVALTKADLIAYARKHSLATKQLDSPRPKWSTVFREVDSRLYDKLKVKREDGILLWSAPWTKDKERNLLLSLCSDYDLKIRVANPDTLIKRLEEEFGQSAK